MHAHTSHLLPHPPQHTPTPTQIQQPTSLILVSTPRPPRCRSAMRLFAPLAWQYTSTDTS
eukprot:2153065-Rhodomonas_salina.4